MSEASTDAAPANGGPRKPDHKIRVGSVVAALWEKQSANGFPIHSITFSKLYKDDDGQWRSTTKTWSRNDLMSLIEVARMAYVWSANTGMRNQSCPVPDASTDSVPQS